MVHTVEGVTIQDIIDARFASEHFGEEPVLFDDVADILGAEAAGLVTIVTPGVVVMCPIISVLGPNVCILDQDGRARTGVQL